MHSPKIGAAHTQDETSAAAVAWLLRMQSGQLGEAQRRQFDAWRAAPEHAAAYARAERLWGAVGEVALDPDILRTREKILAKANRRRDYRVAAVAAGVAMIFVFAALITRIDEWAWSGLREVFAARAAQEERSLATDIGERTSVPLGDGSVVTLNTDSAATVAFDARERTIVLTRGQALFEVAKDSNRPFVVHANDRRIVATGTAFDVRVDPSRVEVTLVEGRVLVGDATADPHRPDTQRWAELSPGERLVADAEDVVSVGPVNVEQITGWTSGKLTFFDARLDEAVAEINRYTRTPIRLDAPLAAMRINGVFRAGRPAEFARAVAQIHPLDVRYGANGEIQLRERSHDVAD